MQGDLTTRDKHNDLYEKITEFWKIVYGCRLYYLYCYHLHNVKSQLEHKYMNHSRFFKKTKHVFWRTLVIEVAKLYSGRKNDKYNIQKLLENLSENGAFKKANIDKEMLKRFKNGLTQHQNVINILIGLRDSFYGHTDTPEKKAKVNYEDLAIEEVEPLIKMAEDIIREVYLKAFDSDTGLRVEFDEKDLEIITILANHKHQKINEMREPKFTFKKPGQG